MVVAPRISGSMAGTSGGGGAGGLPIIRSSTHLPRSTGEVRHAVGGDFKNAGMGHHATAMAAGR